MRARGPRRAWAARRCRRRARVLRAPHAQASASALSSVLARQAGGEEPGVERVAGAGGVHQRPRAARRRASSSPPRAASAPSGPSLTTTSGPRAARSSAAASTSPVGAPGQPQGLLGVGQQDVERVERHVPRARAGPSRCRARTSARGRPARAGRARRPACRNGEATWTCRAAASSSSGTSSARRRPSAPAAVSTARSSARARATLTPVARLGVADDGADVHARGAQRVEHQAPERVVADAGDHARRRARAGRRRAARIAAGAAEHQLRVVDELLALPERAATMSPPRRTRSALASPTTSRSISRAGRGRARPRARPAARRRPRAIVVQVERRRPCSGRAAPRGGRARGRPPARPARSARRRSRNVRLSAAQLRRQRADVRRLHAGRGRPGTAPRRTRRRGRLSIRPSLRTLP